MSFEDVTKQLGDLVDNLDFDAGRLQEIEHRLDTINAITRKYGGTVDDVLDYLENSSKEYNLLTGNSSSSDAMEQELKQLEKTYSRLQKPCKGNDIRLQTLLSQR